MSFPVRLSRPFGSEEQEGIMNGHALSVERVIDARPEAIFDAFIAMYDSRRPDWVTGSQLDLRPGGRWSVDFQVPDGPAFREERVITAIERPDRLAYDMTAVYQDAPGFSTTVEITIEAAPGGAVERRRACCLQWRGEPFAGRRP